MKFLETKFELLLIENMVKMAIPGNDNISRILEQFNYIWDSTFFNIMYYTRKSAGNCI